MKEYEDPIPHITNLSTYYTSIPHLSTYYSTFLLPFSLVKVEYRANRELTAFR